MEFSSAVYNGSYGLKSKNDILITNIECKEKILSNSMNKQIILTVDISGSMSDTLPMIKASLIAFRNSLLRQAGEQTDDKSDDYLDRKLATLYEMFLIVFSDKARCIWESKDTTALFSQVVEFIESENSTNLGHALQLSFDMKKSDCVTWIIVLTDGQPNKGFHQTSESYLELMKNKPEKTKIIPLGYTRDFNPEILNILGDFTFIENEEMIPEVIGSISYEISTAFGFDATITLPSFDSNNEEIINAAGLDSLSLDVINNKNIGVLYPEKSFIYGFLPWGQNPKPVSFNFQDKKVKLSFYHIYSREVIELEVPLSEDTNIPTEAINEFYLSEKHRILYEIYRKRDHIDSLFINSIKERLNEWVSGEEEKQDILRILTSRKPIDMLSKNNYTPRFNTASQANIVRSTQADAYKIYQNYKI